jgi:hypothetical protein
MTAAADLWAITSYFNPMRYRRRLANYRIFRRYLPIPVLTVELSFGGPFELGDGDADILVQRRGGDILWQKERLLNVGLPALPRECRKVVAMDGDLSVVSEEWPECVSRALDRVPVVQPFNRVYQLKATASAAAMTSADTSEFWQRSLPYALAEGTRPEDLLGRFHDRGQGTPTKGFMWAAVRPLLDKHGFFDACIIGGGDSALACAAYGRCEELCRHHWHNDAQRQCYLAWAVPFARDVGGAVSHVDCPVYHLWHGAMKNRRPGERHDGLGAFDFDPARDLAIGPSGAWQWSSDKPALHQYVKDYFASRKEDG